jgi:hypothetical protein
MPWSWSWSKARGAPAGAESFQSTCLLEPQASSAPRVPAPQPAKSDARTDTCYPNRPGGHRRFYLAVLIGRDLRPSSRSMSGIVDSGREGGLGNIDANDPKQPLAVACGSSAARLGPNKFFRRHEFASSTCSIGCHVDGLKVNRPHLDRSRGSTLSATDSRGQHCSDGWRPVVRRRGVRARGIAGLTESSPCSSTSTAWVAGMPRSRASEPTTKKIPALAISREPSPPARAVSTSSSQSVMKITDPVRLSSQKATDPRASA